MYQNNVFEVKEKFTLNNSKYTFLFLLCVIGSESTTDNKNVFQFII